MYLGIKPNLVERTVFEAVRKDATIRPHYERQFADCYEHREGNRRELAFDELHERWFNELGLRDLIAGLVNEFPQFREQVSRLMVTQAPGPKAQAAELFGGPGQYTVVIAVAPASLLDRPAFLYWARHEFMHIDDMLDPAFGFDPGHRPVGATAAGRNLTQDRYAVLWAISVDARLMHRGMAPSDMLEKRRTELMRVFALTETESAGSSFEELWSQAQSFSPNHNTLLEWARHGLPGLRASESNRTAKSSTSPGAPCSLCGFPTFDWADVASDDACLREAILTDFPNWAPDQPICGRCAEVYRACAGVQAVS